MQRGRLLKNGGEWRHGDSALPIRRSGGTGPPLWRDRADHLQRDKWFHTLYTLVAAGEDGHLLGYGNVDDTGYLDHLFVHRDHQREGVASRICSALENHCLEGGVTCMTVHASITARPFFERRGYVVEQVQQVPLRGETLTNYRMSRRWK